MDKSFKQMTSIPDELLAERIELVQALSDDQTDAYDIVKDKVTGEHYLHYNYMHLDIASGFEEMYYQLMPLDHDDVLTLMFDKPDYSYPEYWKKPFLRNGSDGKYVWFSPDYADDFEESVRIEQEIKEKLQQFKQQGNRDPEAIRKLMSELDQLRNSNK